MFVVLLQVDLNLTIKAHVEWLKRTNKNTSRSEIYERVIKNEFIVYNTCDDNATFSKFQDIRLKHFIHQSFFMTSSVHSD